jgi:tRNA modification GTPase
MEFVHRSYQKKDTIAAIATPPGEGGIAVIRISGEHATLVADRVFSKKVSQLATHTVHFGQIVHEGEKLDDVLLLVMRAPRSFTGEDVVEIHCHGGKLITRQVLDAVLQAGARAALPGEFSFQAFMNGKLDLTQAEAIQEMIGAKSERALRCAQDQLEGILSKKIAGFQKKLSETAAIFEAWVDFPEEDLEFSPFETVTQELELLLSNMRALLATFHQGKMLKDGIQLALIGSPNVGKSSLMNALLGKDRAIVSHIPGTTRDVIEDDLSMNGLSFRLLDTAGIRTHAEVIEEEGIKRSLKVIDQADLILLVLDATEHKIEHFSLPPHKTIAVWNKIDLQPVRPLPKIPFEHVVEVSALQRTGIESLFSTIDRVIDQSKIQQGEEILLTKLRHKDALDRACGYLEQVIHGLKHGTSAEFVSSDIRETLKELGIIIGRDITEDVLDAVFSKFCIGK